MNEHPTKKWSGDSIHPFLRWLNHIQGELKLDKDIFQTWHKEIHKDFIEQNWLSVTQHDLFHIKVKN